MSNSDTCEECGESPEQPYQGTGIQVTLTMNPDTARSVLGILEHALAEGDAKLEVEDFDKFTVNHHKSTKDLIERQVLAPIRAGFPPNVSGPEDLVGWDVRVLDDGAPSDGKVMRRDPKSSAHVIVRQGITEWSVHWGLCRVVV
jgi:hypothetical protein